MKRIMKILVVCVCLMLSLALTACSKVEFNYNDGKLVVGLECDYTPFNWTETTKTDSNVAIYGQNGLYAEGYDIQMAKLIAEDLGLELVVKKISWTGLIPALTTGDIDLIIAGMSPTEDRKLSINFSNAYYESEHVVIVKKDGEYANATKFTDFANANIVGQKGTAYENLANQLALKASTTALTPLDTIPLIISGILLGDNDVTIVEKPVALSVCQTNPDLTWIKLDDEFEIDECDKIVSVGVRKIDTDLLDDINESLAKITQEQRDQLMSNASAN